MSLIDIADKIYVGSQEADRVYLGDDLVFSAPLPPLAPIYRRLMPGAEPLVVNTTAPNDYNAYPGFVVMGNGKRLLVERQAISHTGDAGVAKKYIIEADDSISNTETLTTYLGATTNHMDSALVKLASDRVVCVYTVNQGPGGGDAACRMGAIFSDDDGDTFSSPAWLGDNGLCGFDGGAAPWAFVSGPPIEIAPNILRVAYYGTLNDAGGVWTSRVAGSDDGGETWEDMGISIALPANESAAEPNLLLLNDDRQYIIIRAGDVNEQAPGQRYVATWSSDDWATAPAAPITVMLNANARPAVLLTPDGDILLLGRGSVPGGAYPPPSDQGFFAISVDDGISYQFRQQLSASKGRMVYGQACYIGAANTDGALQIAVALEDGITRSDVWLYKLTAPNPDIFTAEELHTEIEGLDPVAFWSCIEHENQVLLNTVEAGVDFRLIGDTRLQDGLIGTVPGIKFDVADDPVTKIGFCRCTDHPSLDITGTAFSIVVFVSHDARSDRVLYEKGGIEFGLASNRLSFSEPTAGQVVSNDAVEPFGLTEVTDQCMYAVTCDGDIAKFYRDGVQFGTNRTFDVTFVANGSDAYLGNSQNGTGAGTLQGSASCATLFDKVLTGPEIAAIWDARPA